MYRYAPNEFRFFSGRRTHGELVVVLVPNFILANACCEKLRELAVVNVQNPVVHPACVSQRRRGRICADKEPGTHILPIERPRWLSRARECGKGREKIQVRQQSIRDARNDPPRPPQKTEHAVTAFPCGKFAPSVRAVGSRTKGLKEPRVLAVVGRRDDERVVGEIQAVERVQNLRERLCPRETCRRAYPKETNATVQGKVTILRSRGEGRRPSFRRPQPSCRGSPQREFCDRSNRSVVFATAAPGARGRAVG